jgi:hypothetical protein
MVEIWRDIVGYEGLYMVSSLGRVKSLGNGCSNNSKERFLKIGHNSRGYCIVKLYKNGTKRTIVVHRLVAAAFIPNPYNLPQVNHKDENKDNNDVSNLEWCTNEYNHNYGTRNARQSITMTNGSCSKPIVQLDDLGRLIRIFPSIMEAGRNGYSISHICNCCKGQRNYHKGYRWMYLSDYEEDSNNE